MMRTRQWIKASILIFMGLYFLDNLISGRVYFYINDRFIWVTWFAAFSFIILGGIDAFDLLRSRQSTKTLPTLNISIVSKIVHDHNSHGAPTWLRLAIVSIPVLAGLFIPARPLGATAIQNNGVSSSFRGPGSSSTDMLQIAPTSRNVLDWVRVFNTSTDVHQFDGQRADFIGFVYRDIRTDEQKQFMVIRFAISCCVADASALGITVQSENATQWAQDGWVHVTGKFQAQTINHQDVPVLIADRVEVAQQPKNPYLYP